MPQLKTIYNLQFSRKSIFKVKAGAG